MTPALPKHLRQRRRYLAVHLETWPDTDLERTEFQRAVWTAARTLCGDIGSAAVDLSVQRFTHSDGTGHAILRIRRGEADRARAVLACLPSIDGDALGLRVAGSSGTIRACSEKYIGREPEQIAQRKVAFEGAERSAVVRQGRVDVQSDGAFVGATDLDFE